MFFDIGKAKVKVTCDNAVTDALAETALTEKGLELYISATKDRPKFIELHWDVESMANTFVLGDAWERSYGNLENSVELSTFNTNAIISVFTNEDCIKIIFIRNKLWDFLQV